MDPQDELNLLAEVASLYYNENLSHQQIADKLFYSRTKVTRMLQKARDYGIVDIKVNIPMVRIRVLEEKLKKQLKLDDVIVLRDFNVDKTTMLKKLCELAANYVDQLIVDNMTIGVSWGTTIYHFVEALKPQKRANINVVQLVGAIAKNDDAKYDSAEIVRMLAAKFDANYTSLHAPLYVSEPSVAKALKDQDLIKESIEVANHADMIITGISDFTSFSHVRWEKHLSKSEKDHLLNQGAIGLIMARFINESGQVIQGKVNECTIGIELEQLRKIKNVICIASGQKKAKALLAAVSGKYVSRLIIDERLASEMINLL